MNQISNFFDGDKQSSSGELIPIFAFTKLKNKLISMGVEIGEAGAWRTACNVDIFPEDIDNRLLFEDDKIYYIDDAGIKRRGFMYKASFYFEYQGKINHPKFHICKCKTIDDFGQDAYRFANAEPIMVYSRNARKEVMVKHMELCGNCSKMLFSSQVLKIQDSTDFVTLLKETGEVKEFQEELVDIFGYVKDWEFISLDFRRKHNYTCNRCGVKVEDRFDHQYIHVHHKNGNKLINDDSNLECLCIQCHAEVDDTHRKNFSKGAKKIMLQEFISKYRN